jgi:hypothetical protein
MDVCIGLAFHFHVFSLFRVDIRRSVGANGNHIGFSHFSELGVVKASQAADLETKYPFVVHYTDSLSLCLDYDCECGL